MILSACRPSAVRLAFVPAPGTTYRYAIHVQSRSTTTLAGQPDQRQSATVDLETVDTVLAVDADGSRLRVQVSEHGRSMGSYLVRLDRQAALISLEAADGRPLDVQAGLQLEDLIPSAGGPPPQRDLHAGDRWQVNQAVNLPRLAPARLIGSGRLKAFGVLDGRRVAVTETTGTVALGPGVPPADSDGAPHADVGLRGRETTTSTVTRAVRDGAVEAASATTSGTFDIILFGQGSALVSGQLVLEVHSTTRRLD